MTTRFTNYVEIVGVCMDQGGDIQGERFRSAPETRWVWHWRGCSNNGEVLYFAENQWDNNLDWTCTAVLRHADQLHLYTDYIITSHVIAKCRKLQELAESTGEYPLRDKVTTDDVRIMITHINTAKGAEQEPPTIGELKHNG